MCGVPNILTCKKKLFIYIIDNIKLCINQVRSILQVAFPTYSKLFGSNSKPWWGKNKAANNFS